MRGRDTPPAPFREGRLGCCFLFGNEGFVVLASALRRGSFYVFVFGGAFIGGVDLGIGVSRNEAMVSSRKQASIVYIPCVDCVRSLM